MNTCILKPSFFCKSKLLACYWNTADFTVFYQGFMINAVYKETRNEILAMVTINYFPI